MEWKSDTEIFSNSSDTNGKVSNLTVGICGLLLFTVIVVILYLILFVYKTYKTTFQRLIIYYIVLSLWLDVSGALLIVGAFTDTNGKWICIVQKYLLYGSLFAWYTYITAIVNFSLLFTICLTRVRGTPLSKQSSRCVECICILSAVTIGLTVASIELTYNHVHSVECTIMGVNLFHITFWGTSLSIFFAMELEVILVSISLCVLSCFIRHRIRNRKTAVLLRNSVIHVAIYASIMGIDSFRVGYNAYLLSKVNSRGFSVDPTIAVIYLVWYVVFSLAIGVSVITQAVLCIQTSREGSACCKGCCFTNQSQRYAAIDGKDTHTAATNPASSRVSQPSYTNFPVPYTGGFTQITTSVNSDRETEQR